MIDEESNWSHLQNFINLILNYISLTKWHSTWEVHLTQECSRIQREPHSWTSPGHLLQRLSGIVQHHNQPPWCWPRLPNDQTLAKNLKNITKNSLTLWKYKYCLLIGSINMRSLGGSDLIISKYKAFKGKTDKCRRNCKLENAK